MRVAVVCWCVYLKALSQVFNDSHMLIEHRLQTEDFLTVWKNKNTREKQLYFLKYLLPFFIILTYFVLFYQYRLHKNPDYLRTSLLQQVKGYTFEECY